MEVFESTPRPGRRSSDYHHFPSRRASSVRPVDTSRSSIGSLAKSHAESRRSSPLKPGYRSWKSPHVPKLEPFDKDAGRDDLFGFLSAEKKLKIRRPPTSRGRSSRPPDSEPDKKAATPIPDYDSDEDYDKLYMPHSPGPSITKDTAIPKPPSRESSVLSQHSRPSTPLLNLPNRAPSQESIHISSEVSSQHQNPDSVPSTPTKPTRKLRSRKAKENTTGLRSRDGTVTRSPLMTKRLPRRNAQAAKVPTGKRRRESTLPLQTRGTSKRRASEDNSDYERPRKLKTVRLDPDSDDDTEDREARRAYFEELNEYKLHTENVYVV